MSLCLVSLPSSFSLHWDIEIFDLPHRSPLFSAYVCFDLDPHKVTRDLA